ncbi:MAG: class I SAM-dependent methyltransferase [Myxococcales bacterium]|nr:class I SAM-dependent methyltransferase [Myxococcales bacterium]
MACGSSRDDVAPAATPPDAVAAPLADRPISEARDEPAPPVAADAASRGGEGAPTGEGPWVPGPDDVPPTHFEGREIAQTMSHLGAAWLNRSERDQEEDTTLLHRALGLEPGQTACDVGAGSGYHTVRMARAVGPSGRVLAVDVQPEMLELLRARVQEAGLHNVEAIEGRPGDPRLPAGACDLVLLVDVYHELAWPEPMLAALRRALSREGRLALVEFRAEDPRVPIKRLHKMSKAQIERELSPRGLTLAESFDGLPWQHLMIYRRAEAPGSRSPGTEVPGAEVPGAKAPGAKAPGTQAPAG